jgi:hypothetical protein
MCLSSHLELDLQAKNTPMSPQLLVFMAESHQGINPRNTPAQHPHPPPHQPRHHPAHYLIDFFHDATKALKKREHTKRSCGSEPLSLHIIWTPGHEGIPENKLVDSLAKEAAKGKSSPSRSLRMTARHQRSDGSNN